MNNRINDSFIEWLRDNFKEPEYTQELDKYLQTNEYPEDFAYEYKVFILNKVLLSLLGNNELVELWWNTSNKAFNMRTPLDASISNMYDVEKYLLRFLN